MASLEVMPLLGNFQTYTLNMPSGMGTLDTGTATVNEAFNSEWPTTFPFYIEIWTASSYVSTREIVRVSGYSSPSRQFTWDQRHLGSTTVYNHPDGSICRIVITKEHLHTAYRNITAVNAEVTTATSNIATLTSNLASLQSQGNVVTTGVITTGEAYPDVTTANGITGPTYLVMRSDGKFWRGSASDTTAHDVFAFAFPGETSSGADQTKRVYLGGLIPGFTGLVKTAFYFPDTATPGGLNSSVGTNWKEVGRAAVNTTSLLMSPGGRNSQNHQAAGTTGTNTANAGTASTLARSDHEHKVFSHIPWITGPTPATGDNYAYVLNKWGMAVDIVGTEVYTKTAGSTATVCDVQWTTRASYLAGTAVWASIYSAQPTLSGGVVITNSGTLSKTTWNADEMLRFNITSVGTGVGAVGLQLTIKAKNTN